LIYKGLIRFVERHAGSPGVWRVADDTREATRSTFLKKRLMSIVGDEVDVRFFVAEAMAP